ncbi:SRPBCC family protein [Mycobacterium decipiens]|uniref:Polyketide cyclase n=1 Tax=Mycobacterium decipiens TaxID=1430326 RepID=A0A1X2LTX9_9MYCO|nr:SRPBCC domain-containing protein [Mycobacterium decipiens]OSC40335.1 polyketide cyclase [Mycobacterium decipiens]
MPITRIDKSLDAHTMTVVADYDAPVERVWQLYADPRQLERFWGPPTWPATVVDHDLRPGGRVSYFMSGPDGQKSAGYWDVLEVDAPSRFVVDDGFADESGQPNPNMPTTRMELSLVTRADGGTTMTVVSTFASTDAMNQMLEMGMEDGMREAMGQIDDVLAGIT